ncbi:phosphate/phosphite/phosphonate ABC transporter substrate-binding protein [Roseicella aerolata]|uniref:Phosphate/phosphite/phosphonate ABC transporter substrate-binding protein n=1 Tax=Roseicella aerolata TaxID=2883479 RepID=A0A9X1IEF1_9PROT|nr:phosphate/phosphite/phosphonate ABC transporter substrate-binding protein [Roseicella aerolata]MCB4822706.1 phosphate/phosphite/phosphonate ABC transporter substrate-binding protein [Roseicella aerolata]
MTTRRALGALLASGLAAPALGQATRPPRRSADPDIAFPSPGPRAWAQQMRQIRIGLLGGENEADRLGRFGAYRALMEETFQLPARLFPASDYAGVIQAFGAKQLDIANMSPAAYAAAWLDTNGGVEPLLTTEEADGSISYVAVMLARADSGITSLEDMRGRAMAWSDPNSASGYLIPRFALRRQGVNPEQYFGRTGFAGGHEQAIIAVLQKQYDAAVTWASGQGDVNQGFTRGTLRAMVDKGLLDMRQMRIIWRSEPIINGPQTVRSDLPAAFKEDMRLFHLALPRAHPEIYRQIERGGGAGYREVSHQDYALMIEMRRQETAERRRRN